jgi:esterase/lipase superfamily enzyme
VLIPVAEAPVGTSRVPVLVATTRERSTTDKGEMFNGDRGEAVSYAAITVSIPPDSAREIGQIQWPASVPGDARRDFVTVSADYIDKPRLHGISHCGGKKLSARQSAGLCARFQQPV